MQAGHSSVSPVCFIDVRKHHASSCRLVCWAPQQPHIEAADCSAGAVDRSRSSAHPRLSMSFARPEVVVIGGGVNGLSCALRAARELPQRPVVTVVADKFLSETTSFGSGGFWMPYTLGDTPDELVARWGARSLERLAQLYRSDRAAEAGVQAVQVNTLFSAQGAPRPPWRSLVAGFRDLSAVDLAALGFGDVASDGWTYASFVADQSRHLAFLTRECQDAGVRFVPQRLGSLEDLERAAEGAQAVVNCSGLGARDLFDDQEVYAVRGQTVRVLAPWVKCVWHLDDDCYVIPNMDFVVLGGTRQANDDDARTREADVEGVVERCARVLPALRSAPVLHKWAGLRPARSSVRLEAETVAMPQSGRVIPVVHNYGHGGAGVTLAWGCAQEAVEELRRVLD